MVSALICLTLGLGPITPVALADDGAAAPLAVTVDEPPPAIPAAQPPPLPPAQPAAIPAPSQPVGPPAPGRTMQQGYLDGKLAAQREPMLTWGAIGAGSSCVLGPLGCLAATGASALTDPRHVPGYYQGATVPGEADYWQGFHDGYSQRLRARRATAAFVGGSIVTGLAAVAVVGILAAETGPVYIY